MTNHSKRSEEANTTRVVIGVVVTFAVAVVTALICWAALPFLTDLAGFPQSAVATSGKDLHDLLADSIYLGDSMPDPSGPEWAVYASVAVGLIASLATMVAMVLGVVVVPGLLIWVSLVLANVIVYAWRFIAVRLGQSGR